MNENQICKWLDMEKLFNPLGEPLCLSTIPLVK